MKPPFQESAETLFSALESGFRGLSEQQAQSRLEKYGENQLLEAKRKGVILSLIHI